MGREIRRVPLDFDWPLDTIWEGFLMPDRLDSLPCPACDHGQGSSGWTAEATALDRTFYPGYGHTGWHDKLEQDEVDRLVREGRLRQLMWREPTPDNPRDREWVTVPRTAAEVNAANAPGSSIFDNLNHDCINRGILVAFRCEKLGAPSTCGQCDGRGGVEAYPGQRAEAEAWEPTNPPAGEGWQLWETTSEGSPISPVFASADLLAEWMAQPERGRDWVPQEAARKFIDAGWAPTAMGNAAEGIRPGVEAIGWASSK